MRARSRHLESSMCVWLKSKHLSGRLVDGTYSLQINHKQSKRKRRQKGHNFFCCPFVCAAINPAFLQRQWTLENSLHGRTSKTAEQWLDLKIACQAGTWIRSSNQLVSSTGFMKLWGFSCFVLCQSWVPDRTDKSNQAPWWQTTKWLSLAVQFVFSKFLRSGREPHPPPCLWT